MQELPQFSNKDGNINNADPVIDDLVVSSQVPTKSGGNSAIDNNPRCTASNPLTKALHWFYEPYIQGTYSLKCFLSIPLQWALGFADVIAMSLLVGFSVGFLVLACLGVPLFYLTCEIGLILAYIDVGLGYYLTEPRPFAYSFPKLGFTRGFPPACCSDVFGRAKFMATESFIYKMIFYEIFVKIVISTVCTVPIYLVGLAVTFAVMPIWYAIDNYMFVQNWICIGYNTGGDDMICHGWQIDNFGDTFLIMVLSLAVLLPLTLKLNNFAAKCNRIVAYFFLTNIYGPKNDDTSSLISNHGPFPQNSGLSTDDAPPLQQV